MHRRGRVARATDCAVPTAPTPRGCEVRTGLTTAVYIWGYAGWRWWEDGRLGWRGGAVVRMDEVKVVAVERALCVCVLQMCNGVYLWESRLNMRVMRTMEWCWVKVATTLKMSQSE